MPVLELESGSSFYEDGDVSTFHEIPRGLGDSGPAHSLSGLIYSLSSGYLSMKDFLTHLMKSRVSG